MRGGPHRTWARRVVRAAGSVWLGVGLLAGLAVYLSLVSVFTDGAARLLGTTPEGLYGHAIPVALGAAACASLIIATVTRVGLRWERLGAWCSHAGVIALVLGSAWFALARVQGDCLTVRRAGWSGIEHFYRKDTFAAYVAPGGQGPLATEIPDLHGRAAGSRRLDVSLATGLPDVRARATGYIARARYWYEWTNDAPNEVPAVMLALADGHAEGSVVLSPRLPGLEQAGGAGYVIVYRPGATAEMLARLARPGPGPGMPHDLALVLTGKDIPPTLVVVGPDEKRWRRKLTPGRVVQVPLAGRVVSLCLVRHLTHAARRCRATAVPPGVRHPDVGPVLQIEVKAGHFRETIFVPFAAYQQAAPAQWLELPGRRRLGLTFSRARRPLPGRVQVARAEALTYPASVMPRDYVCDVEITTDGSRRRETIRLNEPVMLGPYQLSQGSWQTDAEGRPASIVLLVGTRPGLPLIWVGCTMVVLGLPYAFYVKPLLLARRKQR